MAFRGHGFPVLAALLYVVAAAPAGAAGIDAADTPNRTAVAGAIDQIPASGTGPAFLPVINNLRTPGRGGARKALDDLSGVRLSHAIPLQRLTLGHFQERLLNRLDTLEGYGGPINLALGETGHSGNTSRGLAALNPYGGASRQLSGAWLRGYALSGEIENTINAAGSDFTQGGLLLGLDGRWRQNVSLGIAAGYIQGEVDTAGGKIDLDSWQIAGYGAWTPGAWHLDWTVQVSAFDAQSTRRISLNQLNLTATADSGGFSGAAAVQIGRLFGLTDNLDVTPLTGLRYSAVYRDAFTEAGAGPFNLSVGDRTEHSLRPYLGFRLSAIWNTTSRWRIRPAFHATCHREVLDVTSRISTAFAAATGPGFIIDGPDLDRDRLVVGASLMMQYMDRLALDIDWNDEYAGYDNTHVVSITLRRLW